MGTRPSAPGLAQMRLAQGLGAAAAAAIRRATDETRDSTLRAPLLGPFVACQSFRRSQSVVMTAFGNSLTSWPARWSTSLPSSAFMIPITGAA